MPPASKELVRAQSRFEGTVLVLVIDTKKAEYEHEKEYE
jgi:hypothetical protein